MDELPDDAVRAVELFMVLRARASGLDLMLRVFPSKPEDEEILTVEEIAAIEEGRADIARGDAVS